MGAKAEAAAWAEAVRALARDRGLRYEPVGGLNPRGAPQALCPGGTNRITGELAPGFWGAACDADEREEGGLLGGRAVLPGAVLVKAHAPDIARVMPPFDVESVERNPEELIRQRAARRVEFESIEFNRRFLATVPSEHDPIALRETFSPGFLDWCTRLEREVDFGVQERQLYFHWRLRERSRDEYELALANAAKLFARIYAELREAGVATYAPGPWNAGLEPFPPAAPAPPR